MTPETFLHNRHRTQGQSLGSFTHWIFAALLTMFFPSMVTAFDPSVVFGFFCFMMNGQKGVERKMLTLVMVFLVARPLADMIHSRWFGSVLSEAISFKSRC